ncbi:integrase [Bradyrhizobium sp. USDA 4518]
MSAVKQIGKKNIRRRVLSDDELRTGWQAAEKEPYPYGPLIRMLILTGQRQSEVGQASWSEFDLLKREWLIPKERMKMGEAHLVPLTQTVVDLLASLPRFTAGDFLFSTNFGIKPCNGYGKAKELSTT